MKDQQRFYNEELCWAFSL